MRTLIIYWQPGTYQPLHDDELFSRSAPVTWTRANDKKKRARACSQQTETFSNVYSCGWAHSAARGNDSPKTYSYRHVWPSSNKTIQQSASSNKNDNTTFGFRPRAWIVEQLTHPFKHLISRRIYLKCISSQ